MTEKRVVKCVEPAANLWQILSIIEHVKLQAGNMKQKFSSKNILDNAAYTVKTPPFFFLEGNLMKQNY